MGCQIGIATQHSIRQVLAHQVRFSHNWLRGMSGEGAQHAMKMHSNGLAPWTYNPFQDSGYTTCASRYVISTDNLMGDWNDTNYQTDTWRPENAGVDSGQGIEDVIIERNVYRRGPNTNGDLLLVGRRMTYLDNVRDGGGALAVSVHNPGDALYDLLPAEWKGPYFTSRT